MKLGRSAATPALVAIAIAIGSRGAGHSGEAAPAPVTRVERAGDATRLEVTLPGTLDGYALPKRASGRRSLFLLVGPTPSASTAGAASLAGDCGVGAVRSRLARPEGAMRVFRVDFRAESPLTLVRDHLPADTVGLDAADADGDGDQDILLLRRGRIDAVLARGDPPELPETLLPIDAPGVDAYGAEPRIVRDPSSAIDPFWRLATVTGLKTYGTSSTGFALLSDVPLPLTAWRTAGDLGLWSGPVAVVGKKPDGSMILASAPEAIGKTRLRTWLLSPEAEEPRRAVECWSKLPAAERVLDHAFLLLDGRPVLAVTTTSSEKLGLFAEKLLRLFYLGPDRTRAGAGPFFSCETRMNLWQDARIHLLDVDRDGREDLVLSYWKGLKNATAVLDTHLREENGSFATTTRSQEIDVAEEDRSVLDFGSDLDNDGARDLVLVGGGKLLVYAGKRETREGRSVVSDRPSLAADLSKEALGGSRVTMYFGPGGLRGDTEPGRFGSPVVIDLDGDGRGEVLFAGNTAEERGKIVVLDLDARAPRR